MPANGRWDSIRRLKVKYSKLAARIQFLLSKEVSKPPESFYFYHFACVWFIIEYYESIIQL